MLVREIRRTTPSPTARVRRTVRAGAVLVLVVGLVVTGQAGRPAPAADAAPGPIVTATGSFDLPYPRTISYRTLTQKGSIKCDTSDAEFRHDVEAMRLNKYTAVVVDGMGGDCNRRKA